MVLVPNSWFFDQYNRKQDYLAPLNIQVSSMKAPKIVAGQAKTGIQRDTSGEETEAPFLMGLIVDSVVTEVPKAKIKTTDGWLAFVNHLDRQRDQEVKLTSKLKLSGIRNLTLESDLPPSFAIPAGETYILKLTQ